MLDKRMQDAINSQINWEFYSGYLYLSMASQFSESGMSGGQNWMTVQYQEELAHARIMFTYVLTRGGRVLLEAIEQPQTEWPNGLAMFQEALAHEQKVTARIHDLASLALELKDHATYNFLQWFIAEQVEEEETAMDMVQKFKMAGEHPAGLYQLDKELATRVVQRPVAARRARRHDGLSECRGRRPARLPGPAARPQALLQRPDQQQAGVVRPPDLGDHLEWTEARRGVEGARGRIARVRVARRERLHVEQREAFGAGVRRRALDERAADPAPVPGGQHAHDVKLQGVLAGLLQRDEAGHPVRPHRAAARTLFRVAARAGEDCDEGRQLVGRPGVLHQRRLDPEPAGEGAEDALGRRALAEQRTADAERGLSPRLVRRRAAVHDVLRSRRGAGR